MSFKKLANSWVGELGVYEPGRPLEEVARELGFESVEEVIKLASNENALGPSPLAVKAIKKAAKSMHFYPDGSAFYLRKALAKHLGLDMDELMIGHGSNEIIELLAHVYLDRGTNIIMADRAFVVYRLVATANRAQTIAVPMKNLTHDLDAMAAAINPSTKLVFIGNPNNPTGTMVDGAAIDRFMDKVPNHVVVVLDEAYIELLPPEKQPDSLKHVREGRHVYVLRTFSKTYGLAGLRIGYAIAPREGIELLHKVRQPFNVNALGLVAAQAALEDRAFVEKTRKLVKDGLEYLSGAFDKMRLEYVPSVTNFILVKTGKGRSVFEALQRKKVVVRPMDPSGLPDHIRVTVGTMKENRMFIKALKEVLNEGVD